MQWNCKRSLVKNHRNCSLRISKKGRLFRTFNSYSLNFKGRLCNRRTGYCQCRAPCPGGEQFLWFLKNDLLRFHLLLLFYDSIKHLFFEMCLVRRTIANLCPIMIHCNALDFNECCSEEVIKFLLTLSVYPGCGRCAALLSNFVLHAVWRIDVTSWPGLFWIVWPTVIFGLKSNNTPNLRKERSSLKGKCWSKVYF